MLLFVPVETGINTHQSTYWMAWWCNKCVKSHITKFYFLHLFLRLKKCCILKIKFRSKTCRNVEDFLPKESYSFPTRTGKSVKAANNCYGCLKLQITLLQLKFHDVWREVIEPLS